MQKTVRKKHVFLDHCEHRGKVDLKREKHLRQFENKRKKTHTLDKAIQKMSMAFFPILLTILGATKKKSVGSVMEGSAPFGVHPDSIPSFSTFPFCPGAIYFDSSLCGLFASSARDTY